MNSWRVRRCRRVFLEGLRLAARLRDWGGDGSILHPIAIDARLDVEDGPPSGPEDLSPLWTPGPERRQGVEPEALAASIRGVVESREWERAEELGDALAAACLADGRVISVFMRIRSPHVVSDAEDAGIEIKAIREARTPE